VTAITAAPNEKESNPRTVISQEEQMNTKMRFAALAMILAMAVAKVADQGLRLRARQNKQINGFQAELRGD
jgi:hypothetical protein